MRVCIGSKTLELVQGDIIREQTMAIANAANSSLTGGGGVDGAIHNAGGPALMEELRAKYRECPTGSAVITGGGRLAARWVLHAVGPRYRGRAEEAGLLASAYRSCLDMCEKHGIESVAFPSISTGIYGYPVREAAPIALATVKIHLETRPIPVLVRFVLYDGETFMAYARALRELGLPA